MVLLQGVYLHLWQLRRLGGRLGLRQQDHRHPVLLQIEGRRLHHHHQEATGVEKIVTLQVW